MRARAAAERAERETRAREAAVHEARERRARAAVERAARPRRAQLLSKALLDDDVAMLLRIKMDGVVDWDAQRPSVRCEVARAEEKVHAVADLARAAAGEDVDGVRRARRTASAAGGDELHNLKSSLERSRAAA